MYTLKNGTAESCGRSIFFSLRDLDADIHRVCASLHSHQQEIRIPLSLHPCQCLMSFVLLILAILNGIC